MTVEQKSGQQQDADSAAACPEGAEGLSALEADLQAAEARVEAAEARYLRSRRQLARAEEPAPTESEDRAATTAGHTPSASQAARSAAERSEKCLEDRRPPARETLGQLQVQAHGQTSDEVHVAGQAHGEPAAVREGAQSIADRLKRLQRRASAAEMRASAVEVLKGGGYTFEPLDVVLDLQRRGLLEQGFVAELIQWLPPESQVLGPDLLNDGCASSSNDRQFQDAEVVFLRSFEERAVAAAESELVAAEAQLTEVVSQAAARLCLDSIEPSRPKPQPGGQRADDSEGAHHDYGTAAP